MPSIQNIKQVEVLSEKLRNAKAVYFTDYLGLDVSSITDLRRQFYQESVEYTVVKNTLFKLAAKNNDINGLEEFLSGPTAVAISYEEPTKPAKVLKNFTKEHDKPTVKGILFEGEIISGEEFGRIADMPSHEELLTILLAMLQSPLTKLVQTLSAPMSNFVGVLNSLKEKKS